MKKQKYIILGDTRDFHIGSEENCNNLVKVLNENYTFNGFYAKSDFCFDSYEDLSKNILKYKELIQKIEESDIIYCNGEGMIEKNSKWGHSLFYVSEYIKDKYPNKKVLLINFSCCISDFNDWDIFDYVIPRDIKTYKMISKIRNNVKLGFDCTIIQKNESEKINTNQNIVIFKGRKNITKEDISRIKKVFNKNIIMDSIFWDFESKESVKSKNLKELQEKIRSSFLIISTSFHGIIFATRFGIPFIPLVTENTNKNESISMDILQEEYENRNLEKWLEFYSDKENYNRIKNKLKERLPELQERTREFIL